MNDNEKIISMKHLKSLFFYEDGVIYWKHRPRCHFETDMAFKMCNSKNEGRPSGTISSGGYLRTNITFNGVRRSYANHRIIFALLNNGWPDGQIDHIDHNRNNNLISNLRCVNQSDNQKNATRRCDNKSGVTGVHWHNGKGKWCAEISSENKKIYIGSFDELIDAIAERKRYESNLNFHKNHGVILCH